MTFVTALVNSMILVNVELSDSTNYFCICGSKEIEDSLVLQWNIGYLFTTDKHKQLNRIKQNNSSK